MAKAVKGRALIVDDERVVLRILTQTLEDAGYEVETASSGAETRAAFSRLEPDIVLLDYKLPDESGLDVLKAIRKISRNTPVVMITAHASIPGAVQAVKEGVYDYVSKPFEEEEILMTVDRALEASRLRDQVERRQNEDRKNFGLQNIVAKSPAMLKLVQMLRRIAENNATTVLLLGESGVGKGLIARALHLEGADTERPFMNITCTALPEALLESELFGHEKGAFTDARNEKKGLLELAKGGTVFLDEIGDMPPALQSKLLRFLEDKTFRRVGGTRDIRVNVRVIAATNKDLQKEVEAGRFRGDLFFRLNVITVEIPPLRERKEDILPLCQFFLRHYGGEFHKSIQGLDPDAQECVLDYRWPGNVRELRNVLERAVLLNDSGKISLQDLPESVQKVCSSAPPAAASEGIAAADPSAPSRFVLPAKGLDLEEVEKDLVLQALRRTEGNHVQASRLLGMNRHQIRYRIEKYNLSESLKAL